MRSRNGSYTFSLKICSIVFILIPLALNASEYLISYRYVVKDAILYNEKLYVSKAMQKCEGYPQETTIFRNSKQKSLKLFLSDRDGEFISYLHKLGLYVKHNEVKTRFTNNSTTILMLKTECFDIDVDKESIFITPIK